MLIIAVLTASALAGAMLSAAVGIGGGNLLMAAMVLLGMAPGVAVPVHAAVQLFANGTRVAFYARHVLWRPFLTLALPAIPAAAVGMWLRERLDTDVVKAVLGASVLFAAWAPKDGLERVPRTLAFALAGVIGGGVGVIVGAVGPLVAPFLARRDMAKEQLVATLATCAAYLHVVKIVAFAFDEFAYVDHADVIVPLAAATIVGTYIGKGLLERLSDTQFALLFRVVLSALALRLIATASGL